MVMAKGNPWIRFPKCNGFNPLCSVPAITVVAKVIIRSATFNFMFVFFPSGLNTNLTETRLSSPVINA